MMFESLISKLKNLILDVEFWDVRFEETTTTNISFDQDELNGALVDNSKGAFLRVRKKGRWYYQATTSLNNIEEQLEELAYSNHLEPAPAWKKPPQQQPIYTNFRNKDFNSTYMEISKKVDLTKEYLGLLSANSFIKSRRARYTDLYKVKYYINSVGTQFSYDIDQYGLVLTGDLADGNKIFSDQINFYNSTFQELSTRHQEVTKYFNEAVDFLQAEHITPGTYNLVLSPAVTGTVVHESFGHMSEADGYYTDPKAKDAWKLGRNVAVEAVSIVDDGSQYGHSGYCPIDDEGFPHQKHYLVKDGNLVGRMHSYETADYMDESPTGNARAMNFEFEPIVRMSSTYIENGTTDLKDLFKMADGALYIESYNHGAGGEVFTVGPNRCYRINGLKLEPVICNVISGNLFSTLKEIVAVGNDFLLESSAFGGCGKMEQWPLPVSSGGPTIFVKNMQVG